MILFVTLIPNWSVQFGASGTWSRQPPSAVLREPCIPGCKPPVLKVPSEQRLWQLWVFRPPSFKGNDPLFHWHGSWDTSGRSCVSGGIMFCMKKQMKIHQSYTCFPFGIMGLFLNGWGGEVYSETWKDYFLEEIRWGELWAVAQKKQGWVYEQGSPLGLAGKLAPCWGTTAMQDGASEHGCFSRPLRVPVGNMLPLQTGFSSFKSAKFSLKMNSFHSGNMFVDVIPGK